MITETRQSRTRHIHYEHHRRQHRHQHHHRRHHTLDNATLDKFNFICVPLHPDESRIDSSSSHTNLTMTQPTQYTISTTSTRPPPTTISTITATRRVRFKFDDNDKNYNIIHLNNNRHSRSSDDVRAADKNCIHRVEFQIPVHQDINPWLNVDCSTSSSAPAKTRSLTSKKIDIKHTNINNNNSMRVQGIAPFIEAEISSPTSSTNDSEKNQAQWYRQMYGHLHKSSEIKQDQQQNPYKPTYTFPEEFDGDLDRMEDYIRQSASQTVDNKDHRNMSSVPIRPIISNLKDQRATSKRTNGHIEKVTRFEDHYSSPVVSPPTERIPSNNDASTYVSSSMNTSSRLNSNHISSSDNEQKLIYKRILRGGDIPSNGLQKVPNNTNNRGKNTKNISFTTILNKRVNYTYI